MPSRSSTTVYSYRFAMPRTILKLAGGTHVPSWYAQIRLDVSQVLAAAPGLAGAKLVRNTAATTSLWLLGSSAGRVRRGWNSQAGGLAGRVPWALPAKSWRRVRPIRLIPPVLACEGRNLDRGSYMQASRVE